MAKKRSRSIKTELLEKSREAALNAVQTYNNPLTKFKTESFIVLMNIAWTYLLHAYYRERGIEYRYYRPGPKRRRFDRTKSGAFKYWELERCLNDDACPLDGPTKLNLRFLIGLRHEIEHHSSTGVDQRLSNRYLACCLNYERYICELFDRSYSLDEAVAFTLQFRDLTAAIPEESVAPMSSSVAKYVEDFDADLSEDDMKSPHFRRRFLFVPYTTNKMAQADTVIEFVPLNSDLANMVNDQYHQVFLKEVERVKLLPGQIVSLIQTEGYGRFTMHYHTQLWKQLDAKNPGKGYGVQVASTWYWYERWIEKVREHCNANSGLYCDNPDGIIAA
jgi:hypothetical protein